MANVQRSCGVGRNKLDVYTPSLALLRAPVFDTCSKHILEDLSDHRRGQPDIDEARTRNLNRVFVPEQSAQLTTDILGNVTRFTLQRFGQLERNVGGEVPMAGIAGTLNENFDIRRAKFGYDLCERLAEPVGPGGQDTSPVLGLGLSLAFGLSESDFSVFAGSFFSDFSDFSDSADSPVSYLVRDSPFRL